MDRLSQLMLVTVIVLLVNYLVGLILRNTRLILLSCHVLMSESQSRSRTEASAAAWRSTIQLGILPGKSQQEVSRSPCLASVCLEFFVRRTETGEIRHGSLRNGYIWVRFCPDRIGAGSPINSTCECQLFDLSGGLAFVDRDLSYEFRVESRSNTKIRASKQLRKRQKVRFAPSRQLDARENST